MNSNIPEHTSLINPKQGNCLEESLVRILVVDDFEPFRRLLSTMLLSSPQFEVVAEAVNGLDALQKAEELKPDLILLDVDLPKLNGFEVARNLRNISPDSRILFVSANTFPDVARAALDTGASGYVVKFDAATELLSAIETVLLGKQYVSPRLAGLGLAASSSE